MSHTPWIHPGASHSMQGSGSCPSLLRNPSQVSLVIGLGFGDEGKGAWVDALTRFSQARLVVRFNGGPQAGHRVVSPEGVAHIFAQLGAGSFVPGCETLLARQVAVDPLALQEEAEVFAGSSALPEGPEGVLERVTVDPRCPVVTVWHALLNQVDESLRGDARHGSCGRGVGVALLDAESSSRPVLRFEQLFDPVGLARALRFLALVQIDRAEQRIRAFERDVSERSQAQWGEAREKLARMKQLAQDSALADRVTRLVSVARQVQCKEDASVVAHTLASGQKVIGEGAQGVLLDRADGFWPHVTPSHTDARQALTLFLEVPQAVPQVLGVLRAWHTRHGAGPLPSESASFTQRLPDIANRLNLWQGAFRVGALDLVLLRYALELCAAAPGGEVQGLLLSGLDRVTGWDHVPWVSGWGKTPPPRVLSRQGLAPAALLEARQRQTQAALAAHGELEQQPGWSVDELPAAQLPQRGQALRVGPGLQRWLERLEERVGVPVVGLGWGESALTRALAEAAPGTTDGGSDRV